MHTQAAIVIISTLHFIRKLPLSSLALCISYASCYLPLLLTLRTLKQIFLYIVCRIGGFKKTGRLFLLSLLLFSIAFHNNASAQAKQKKPQIKSFSKKLFVGKSYYVKVKNRPKKSTLSYSLSKTSRAKINKKTGQLTTRKSGKITIRVRIKSKNRKYKSLHKSVQIYEQTKTSKISGVKR